MELPWVALDYNIMLKNIKIASPCSADWEQMKGDDRVRHCPECNHNVYNLSALTADEAEQLIEEHAGRLCTRFYQRADGTVLTQECSFRSRPELRPVSLIARAALSAAMTLSLAAAQTTPQPESQPVVNVGQTGLGLAIMVLDRNGAGIPGALVTLDGEVEKIRAESNTDEQGKLTLPLLPPDTYQLTIKAPGLKTYRRSVTVGERSEIQAESSETSTLIDSTQITNLESNGRGVMAVMGLYPGVKYSKSAHTKTPRRKIKPKPTTSTTEKENR